MEESPVVYQRRPRKPLSELPWNVSDDHSDPESHDDHGTDSVTLLKQNRKSWSHRTPSTKRRRGDMTSMEEFYLKDRPWKSARKHIGRKGKHKSTDSEGEPLDKEPHKVHPRGLLQSPIEFVREKRAMFAAIDSFELESEEESPEDKKSRTGTVLPTDGLSSKGESMESEGEKGEKSESSKAESKPKSDGGINQPESDVQPGN